MIPLSRQTLTSTFTVILLYQPMNKIAQNPMCDIVYSVQRQLKTNRQIQTKFRTHQG